MKSRALLLRYTQRAMFSKVIRRTHMYLGLFLAPWMLMYALSTIAMNHRDVFRRAYGEGPPPWQKERESLFEGSLPDEPKTAARVLLQFVGLDGANTVSKRAADGALVINRLDALNPRRITYTSADHKLLVERQVFRTNAFLERMHRRRGYQQDYTLDDTYAVFVDIAILAMLFWGLSGIWLWWEMKATRRWGALAMATGALLFAVFLSGL